MGRARRALVGAVLLDFSVCPLFLWGVFSASLSRELHLPTTSLSLAYSVGLVAFTVGVLVGGRLADAVAPRRLALVSGGGVVAGLSATAVASSLPVLVLGFGVVLGGVSGLGYATAVRVAGTASSRRGVAVALVVSAYAAGAVVLAPAVEFLLNTMGRTGMFVVLAAVLGILIACSSLLLPATASRIREASTGIAGILPYRVPILVLWTMFLLGSAPALIAFGHPEELARAPELAVVAVLLLNAGNFVGRLIAGPLADRVGHMPALHVTAGVLVGACVALAVARHPGVTLSALLMLGLQYGAVSVLTPLAVTAAVPDARFGTAYGIVFSGWGLGGFAGPVGAAWLATGASYTAVAGMLVGVAMLFWAAVMWVSAVLHPTRRSAS